MSLQDRLASIEGQYKETLVLFDCMSRTETRSYGTGSYDYFIGKYHTDEYEANAIKAAMGFQRQIELLFEDIQKLNDTYTKYYIDRCIENVTNIRISMRGTGLSFVGVCSLVDRNKFDNAYSEFVRLRSYMYGFFEDVKLIYSLRLYPVEEKMALKSSLTDLGFLEVSKCLEEAEKNLAEKRPKECVDRCREALDKIPCSMLMAANKKPSLYFATDIGTLAGMGVLDKDTKKLAEATFAYFSELGPHGRGGEVTPQDAHYALKETYMRIDILLKKFEAYLKSQKLGSSLPNHQL